VSVSTARELRAAARALARAVDRLKFGPPVSHVYDPLTYAWRGHAAYIDAYGATRKRVVYVGMNPGPFGMAQTGVPFGEVASVRDWLGITARVDRPAREHPKRPVEGFACPRSEVSGTRVWGAVREHYGTPARFFRHAYVANYCPLMFMEASGRNRTPDKLPLRERVPLFDACDEHLRRLLAALEPEWVVGVGGFAEQRCRAVAEPLGLPVFCVLHPSPASPRANKDWAGQVRRQLQEHGICLSRTKD
jgi:single-strand selective monofunctional uracil DNA glycosylase